MRNLLQLSFAVLICLSSCTYNKEDISPEQSDYYPTGKDSKWVYASSDGAVTQTQSFGDTLLDNTHYAMIGEYRPSNISYPTQLVRKENGRYYARGELYGIFREEILFLQDNLPEGATWSDEISGGKDVYSIISIDKKRIITGKEYKNTIEVKREFFNKDHKNEYILGFTQVTIYAKGIGIVSISSDQFQGSTTLKEYEIR